MAQLIRGVGFYGTGSYLPERVVPNEEFTKFVDTSDEWIRQRTGIRERRFARDDEFTSHIATNAAKRALADAGWQATDLDFLCVGTCSPDSSIPNTADWVHGMLGCKESCGAVDLINACSSFTYALAMVSGMIASGQINKALVIGAEKLSSIINMKDRTTCILFGDGAGAACIAPSTAGVGEILASRLGAKLNDEALAIPSSGCRMPITEGIIAEAKNKVRMNGRMLYQFAVTTIEKECTAVCQQAGVSLDQIKCVIPHQVNIRIIESAVERLKIPMERFYLNLDRYGNTSAGSVPTALDEARRAKRFDRGDLIMIIAFGGGVAWGSQVIRW